MKLAAIDIGSNAVRQLFMNAYETEDGTKFVKDTIYRVPLRLGEDAFLKGKISDERIDELIKTMKAFKNLMDVHHTEKYMACATSAMREAKNGKKVIEKIYDKTGIKIEVISGNKEAEIIFSNHIEDMLEKEKNYLYIDVGGGSTELIFLSKGKMVDKRSFNIGTLRVKHNMIEENVWQEMKNWLQQFGMRYDKIEGIGSGGNINFVLKNFTKSKRSHLSRDILDTCYKMMKLISERDRKIKLEMRPDRADVIMPALEIFRKITNWLEIDVIHVPKSGLPDGIIKQLYLKYKKK